MASIIGRPFRQLPNHDPFEALNEAKVPIIIPMPEGTFQRPQDGFAL